MEVCYALLTFWLSKSTTTGIYRFISVDLLVYRYISVHIGTPAYTYIYANIYTNIYMYNISGQRCIRHTYSRSIPLPTPRRSADMYRYRLYTPIYTDIYGDICFNMQSAYIFALDTSANAAQVHRYVPI
jgi:hypothetical protein